MKLIDRQIEAVRETLKQVVEEYKKGKGHHWMIDTCPLCKKFYGSIDGCPKCMLNIFATENETWGCISLSELNPTVQEIAGFLKSLEISLEEMR